MTTALPVFVYHPFPLQTGAVKPSTDACACCGQPRGFVYTASVYGSSELRGKLCPWCIADGSAASKFELYFSDDHPLLKSGVPKEIVDEVTRRTPGYISWQQEECMSQEATRRFTSSYAGTVDKFGSAGTARSEA